jgi:hypothetical protein
VAKTNLYKTENGRMKEISVDIEDAIEIYKEDPLQVYPKGFFNKMVKLRGWQRDAGDKICKQWGVKSIVDFGCASGYYLEGFFNNGAKIRGYEYAYENTKKHIPEELSRFISFGDAQTNLIDEKYDMSFSIEVAEHILPESSQTFVDNLCFSSSKFVVFSAAPPGQGGTGHINERPFEEWKDMFRKNDFKYSQEDTDKLRKVFKTLPSRGPYVRLLSRQVTFFIKED